MITFISFDYLLRAFVVGFGLGMLFTFGLLLFAIKQGWVKLRED